MRPIQVSDVTFTRLQKMAVPLVDNDDTVIQKLLDTYERSHLAHANGNPTQAQSGVGPRQFSADSLPDLKHTKLLHAKLNGKPLRKAKWNELLLEAIRLAKAKARTDDELRRLVSVNFVRGKKDDDGYHFVPDIGLSVQGQDARSAWKGAYHIAQQLAIPIDVEFQWRVKAGAAFPGVTGRLSA